MSDLWYTDDRLAVQVGYFPSRLQSRLLASRNISPAVVADHLQRLPHKSSTSLISHAGILQ